MPTRPHARKLPRQSRSRATFNAVLDASAHILKSGGFDALNTNRVAETAGVSIGSLYQYFPDKFAILQALRERHVADMRALVAAYLPTQTHAPLIKLIPLMVRALTQAHQIDPALHQALEQHTMRELAHNGDPAWELELRQHFTHLLTANAEQLRITDPAVASLVLIRSVDALIHATLRPDPLGIHPKELEAETVTLAQRYLLKEAP